MREVQAQASPEQVGLLQQWSTHACQLRERYGLKD